MGRESYKIVSGLALFLALLCGCKKDKPTDPVAPPQYTADRKVFVVCEGSLGNGNSSLSMYEPKTGNIYEDVFKAANNEALGDVFQSMTLIGDKYFLCINNSDKIVAINKTDRKTAGIISVPKPRYILDIKPTKAYVSSLFGNKVYIVNPQTYEVTGNITLPYQNPEGMLLLNGKAYISAWDTACNKIFVVNIATDEIEREITIGGRAPQEILADADERLWVLAGNVTRGKQATLSCIEPATGNVVKSYTFPQKADPLRPVFTASKDMLYFIEVNYNGGVENNGVYRMHINDAALPVKPFIPAAQFQYFWALGIEPDEGSVYVGDPKGFIQKGTAYIYDTAGRQLNQFATGVGPGHFYFDR